MRVSRLKEYLSTLPDNMEVFVQTCEGDLCSPLEMKNMWVTEATIDERYKTLNSSRMIVTSFINGQETTEYKNDKSGVMYRDKPAQDSGIEA